MTGLNYMAQVPLDVTASRTVDPGDNRVTIRLHNPSQRVAFFERAELTSTPDGDEILPIEYSDNYVTVFPGETVEVQGQPWTGVRRQLGEGDGLQHPAHRGARRLVRRQSAGRQCYPRHARLEGVHTSQHSTAIQSTAAKLTVAVAPISSSLPR